MKQNETVNIFKSAASYGFFTMLSRISGFARDMMIASFFGAGIASDVFFTSFKITNAFRRMFADGALSPAFVPIFSSLADRHPLAARKFTGDVIVLLTIITTTIVITMELFAEPIISSIAPGLSKDYDVLHLAKMMLQINLPFLISITITAIMGGALNSINVFSYFAAIPILLNCTMIIFLLFFRHYFSNYCWCLSYAVVCTTMVQPFVMLFGCKKYNVLPIFRFNVISGSLKKFIKRMLPVVIGQGVFQINVFIDSIFASFLFGAISYLYYTDRVGQFATTIIGHTLGIVALPLLSRKIRDKQFNEALALQASCIKWSFILTIPAMAFIAVFAPQIVLCIYRHGNFTEQDSLVVANMLAIYAVGIFFVAISRIYNSCIFAMGNVTASMVIGIISVILNATINIALMHIVPYYSIIIATVSSTVLECFAISAVLHYKYKFLRIEPDLILTFIKAVAATIIMITCMTAIHCMLIIRGEILTMCIIMFIGGSLYLAFLFLLKIVDMEFMRNLYINLELPSSSLGNAKR